MKQSKTAVNQTKCLPSPGWGMVRRHHPGEKGYILERLMPPEERAGMSEREWLARAAFRELGEDWTEAAAHIARVKDELAALLGPTEGGQKYTLNNSILESLAHEKADLDAIPARDMEARYALLSRLLDLTRDPLLSQSAACVESLASVVAQLAWAWPHFEPDRLALDLERVAASDRNRKNRLERAEKEAKERNKERKKSRLTWQLKTSIRHAEWQSGYRRNSSSSSG